MTPRPNVLLIDDDDQAALADLLSDYGINATHAFPGDLDRTVLHAADLIVVDEFLEDWPRRDDVADHPGLNVRDGVSLAAVLRAELESRGPSTQTRPTPSRSAMVLRTGHLERLAWGLPEAIWSIAVAGRYDLEWVSSKQTTTAADLAAIAHAAAALPNVWDPADPTPQTRWLNLPDAPWSVDALAQIEQSWFMQRILPFPTFLVDDAHAASYLGVHVDAIEQLRDGPLKSAFAEAEYDGQLAAFAGRRWWRAAINDLQARAGGGNALSVAAGLEQMHGAELPTLDLNSPVFTLDRQYRVDAAPIEAAKAVRLQPDEWPPYADDPWVAVDTLDDEPDLRKLVVLDDRLDDAD
jgi:hypothetical protein